MLTLLGGGATEKPDLIRSLAIAPRLICADSGGDVALAWGLIPELVIGDLDSVDLAGLAAAGVPAAKVDDQNSTDFEKCLATVQAPVVLAVGFMGMRLDHQLAALNALAKFPDQSVILIGEVDICFLCPTYLRLMLPVGERLSIFPMSICRCKSRGLAWPLDGLEMRPDGQVGTSNRVSESEVSIEVESGKPICVLPKQHLELVVNALAGR